MIKNIEKIEHKTTFYKMLAFRLGIEKETLRNYIETNRVPDKHFDRIQKAVNVQVQFDEKTKKELYLIFDKL